MEIIKRAKSKWGMSINKSFQSYCVYNFEGNIDLENQSSREALRLAEESGVRC
jgi:hypothetical protein